MVTDFLHKKGYTLFTIPKLTYREMNLLIETFNKKQKKKISEYKKQERLSKRKGSHNIRRRR